MTQKEKKSKKKTKKKTEKAREFKTSVDSKKINKYTNIIDKNIYQEKKTKLKVSNNDLTSRTRWYIKDYKEKYLQFPTSNKILNFIKDKKNDYLYIYGAYKRLGNIINLSYNLQIDIVNTICTIFKIRDTQENIETIYSFGYYEKTEKRTEPGFIPHGCNFSYKYFNIGGSFMSKDGEYRSGIIEMKNIKTITENPNLRKVFTAIREYLVKKITERRWSLFKEYFFPTDDQKICETELEYRSYVLQMELFILTWFNDMFNEYHNIVENHLNAKYKQIIFKYKIEDLEFFNTLIKLYGNDVILQFRNISMNIFNDSRSAMITTKLGQKITPLTIAEAQNPFNIKYGPWKEYLISNYFSNFVVNNVSPGFCMINAFFYIKNARKGLFDNNIQYEKMERSELALQIVELLNRAQLFTHENIRRNSSIKKEIISHLSQKFKVLHTQIQDPIDFAKEEIIMSNVALCMISEYVGRTIMDVLYITRSSSYYNEMVCKPFTLPGYPFFAKYMFDLCYNIYCMNSIGGVIHGDLHLNNVTLNDFAYKGNYKLSTIKNPTVLYVLGDKKNQYIFPTCGYNISIIDFSRSIILPEKIENFNDDSLPKSHSIIKNLKKFQSEQVERMLNVYLNYTDSYTNQDEIRILIKNHFEAVFKLLTATDIYGFTLKLLKVFEIGDKSIVVPHKNCIDLLKKLNNSAEQFVISEMNKLIHDKAYEKHILEMEWPISTIIKNCFYNYLIETSDMGNIVDIYNISNKLTFSLNKLDNFPDSISEYKELTHNNKITTIDITKIKNRRKKFEKKKVEGMKMINYIANRQKHKYL